jgi:acetyl-CoA C-acetyltransferase
MSGGRRVFIVDGARTPFLKVRSGPGPFSAADLATAAGQALLLRQPFAPDQLDEVIVGCAAPSPDEVNIGRVIALRLGCGHRVPGWTVMRNCASGLQAIDSALTNIRAGRAELVLAGGVDALSRAPVLFSDEFVRVLAAWQGARTLAQRAAVLRKLRPSMLKPVIGLLKGLTDPVAGLSMGQTAENLAHRFRISRADMDAFALTSHQRAAAAHEAGRLAEIVPIVDRDGQVHDHDDGVRPDSSLDKLAKLKPFFDPVYGRVTPGNSSQITDGAAWVLLASEAAIERYGLTPLAECGECVWAGLDPAQMGLGPIHAMAPLLQRRGMALAEIDALEINEAFAAQVLACQRASVDNVYGRAELGLDGALGEIDGTRLNVDGGAIAVGHPVGASGARIVLHLAHVLRQTGGRTGIAAICIGGGQGGAMWVERTA